MKKHLLYISIVLLIASSCQVTRHKGVDYSDSSILNKIVSKSQDSTVASLIINVIDLQTKSTIPLANVEISNAKENQHYTTNDEGNLLIPVIQEGIYSIKITYVGCKTLIINEIELSNNKDVWLSVGLYVVQLPGHL